MIIANSNTIEDLKTSLNHVYVEIQDLKNDKTKLAEKFTQQQKSLVNMEERIADAEHYKRRCAYASGLSKQPNEDVKAKVIFLIQIIKWMPTYCDNKALPHNFLIISLIFIENKCFSDGI